MEEERLVMSGFREEGYQTRRSGEGYQGTLAGLGRGAGTFEKSQACNYSFGRGGLYCHVLHPEFIFGEDRVVQNNGKSFISRVV